MQTPFKKIIVYDLETGGLLCEQNSITEIAMVAVCHETLTIIDEMSVMLLPRVDLNNTNSDPEKEAKELYKRLGEKDSDTGIKTLMYGNEKITLKNLEPLIEGITKFNELIESEYRSGILLLADIEHILTTEHKNIMEVYYNNAYTPGAEVVTKISKKMLIEEGISYEDAFKQVDDFIKKHKEGNNKPIMCGHNIGILPRRIVKGKEVKPSGFDNPFMEVFFKNNNSDYFSSINDLILDTLVMARLKFTELPSYSLGVIADKLGLTLKSAHRALADTKANALVLIKLLQSLRGSGGKGAEYKREKFTLNY